MPTAESVLFLATIAFVAAAALAIAGFLVGDGYYLASLVVGLLAAIIGALGAGMKMLQKESRRKN